MSLHAPSTDRGRSSGSSTSKARALPTTAVASSLAKMDLRLRAMHATLPCIKALSPDLLWRPVTVTSLNGGCGGRPKRAASAAEGGPEEVEADRGAELVWAAVEVAGGANLVAAAVSPRFLMAPSARARCSASRARAESCMAESAAACASTAAVFRRSYKTASFKMFETRKLGLWLGLISTLSFVTHDDIHLTPKLVLTGTQSPHPHQIMET